MTQNSKKNNDNTIFSLKQQSLSFQIPKPLSSRKEKKNRVFQKKHNTKTTTHMALYDSLPPLQNDFDLSQN